ncbi:MAG: hypothetical protein F6K31_31640 [Symploca sp. SIO2G7]|nr:hypothetical protein [Symploca sp. SIO2G7]
MQTKSFDLTTGKRNTLQISNKSFFGSASHKGDEESLVAKLSSLFLAKIHPSEDERLVGREILVLADKRREKGKARIEEDRGYYRSRRFLARRIDSGKVHFLKEGDFILLLRQYVCQN